MNQVWYALGRIGYSITHPLIAVYLGHGPRVRAIVIHNNAVLAVKPWLNNGTWDLPGGGLERGESVADCAVRELREELGLMVDQSQVSRLVSEPFRAGFIKYQAEYVVIRLNAEPAPFKFQKIEIVDALWADVNKLRTLPMVSSSLNRNALQALTQ